MRFSALEILPEEAAFGAYLDDMHCYADTAWRQSPDTILEAFFGFPVSSREHHIAGIDHVAFYIGDYRTDTDVERWFEFLDRSCQISDLKVGPSYISPREYGTQGYWISCALGGMSIEMFSSKSAGYWKTQAPCYKVTRMSHFALAVPQVYHLHPLLTYFAHYGDVSILSYSHQDALGHTYGHLLNRKTDCVLELVHAGATGVACHDDPHTISRMPLGVPHGR